MTTANQSRPIPRTSAVDALTRIRDLCDGREHGPGPGWIPVDEVRAVLDAVPVDATPPQGIDRATLVAFLRTQAAWGPAHCELVADRILALMRPVEGVTLTPLAARLEASA